MLHFKIAFTGKNHPSLQGIKLFGKRQTAYRIKINSAAVRKRHLQLLPRGSGLSKNRYFFRHGSGGTMAVVRKSQPGEQQRNQEDGRNSLPLAYSLPKTCFWPKISFMPGG